MAEHNTADVNYDNTEDRIQLERLDAGDHMWRRSHRNPHLHPCTHPPPTQTTEDETPQASSLPMQKPQAKRIPKIIMSPRAQKTFLRGHRNQLNYCLDMIDYLMSCHIY